MARMTGGKAVVKALIGHGVDTIFGLPGVQMDALYNALYDEGNAIRVLHTRHEQAAGYMAFGYAQASGRVGVFAVVPGPGLLNTTSALATAYACNARVLAVAGQIPAPLIGRGFGQLHEIPDQLALVRGLTKWARRIDHPSEAPGRLDEAFRELMSGRARPVEVEIPWDVLALEAEVAETAAAPADVPPPIDHDRIAEAAKLIGQARAPLIFVGSGALDAGAEVLALARTIEAPVVANRGGRGVIDDRDYHALPHLGGWRLWPGADVVVAIGSRLQVPRTQWGTDAALKVVHIDIDPTEITRVAKPTVGLVGDAGAVLAALIPAVERANRRRESREAEIRGVKAAVIAELDAKLAPQMAYLRALRRALPENGILVDELTQVGYLARVAFPIYEPRTFLHSGYQGTLGFGFATALGAKVAKPDRPVLSINGDGGFLYNVQELASAIKHGIDLVAVVFVDGAFGNVRRMQRELYGGRVIATEFANPDFVALAESFGAAAEKATSPEALTAAIARGFARSGPTLIAVPMGEVPDPWPILVPPRNRPAA